MPGDAIIGKVAVKVIPDTKLFKDDLEKQLEKIEKQLDDVAVQIRPVLDGTNIKAEAKRIQEDAQKSIGRITLAIDLDDQDSIRKAMAQVQTQIDNLNADFSLPVSLNRGELYAAMDELQQALDAVAHIDLYVDEADPNSVKAAIAKLDAELQKMQPTVDVALNEEALLAKREELAAILAEFDSTIEIQVDMSDTADVRQALAGLQKQLKKLKAPKVPIKLDEASLAAEIAKLETALDEAAHIDLHVDRADKKSIAEAMAQIDAALQEFSIPLSVHLDEASLRAEKAKLEAELNAIVRDEEYTLLFDAALKNDAERDLLADVDAAVKEVTDAAAKLKIKLDTKEAKAQLAELEATLIDLENTKAKVGVELSPIEVRKTELEIEKLKAKIGELRAEIVPNIDKTKLGLIEGLLDIAARTRTATIKANVDKSFASAIGSIGEALGKLGGVNILMEKFELMKDIFSNFDKYAISIGMVATKLGAVGATAFAAAGQVLAIGQSLASIGPGALALPGIFGGLAVGLGLSAIALKDFSKYVPEASAMWAKLKATVSDNFWEVAAKPMRNMVDTLLPQFSEQAGQTATLLGGYFGNLADSLTKKLGPAFDVMFEGLDTSIHNASAGTDGLAGVITELGIIGTQYLPQLANFFVDVTNKLDAWLTKNEDSGKVFTWIDTAITNLKALGGVLWNVVGILGGLAEAATAAGGTGLVQLNDGLAKINEVVNSPGFQYGLTQVFQGAYEAFSQFADAVGPGIERLAGVMSGFLNTVFPIIGATVGKLIGDITSALADPNVMSGLVQMFQGIQNAVNSLSPIWPALAGAIGLVAPVVGQLLDQFAKIAAVLARTLVPILEKIMPPISSLIDSIGGALLTILTNLEPTIQKVGEKVGELLVQFQLLWNQIAPVLIPVLQFLAEILLGAVIGAIDGAINVIKGIISVIQGVIDFVTGVFTGDWGKAWDGIKEILSGVLDLIIGVFELWWNLGILKVFKIGYDLIKGGWQEAWTFIKDFVSGIFDGITSFIGGFFSSAARVVEGGLSGIKQYFGLALDYVKTVVSNGLSNVLQFFKDLPGNIVSGLGNAWSGVTSFFAGVPGKILSALGNVGSLLTDVGKSIIQSLITGFTNMFDKVKSTLSNLTSFLPDWKGPAKLDRVLLTDAGSMIIDGFIDGLESRYDAVKESLKGLTSDIAGTDMGTLDAPNIASAIASQANGAASTSGQGATRILNYYAAEGTSLSSEEELFTAAGRSRMGGW